MDTKIEYMQVVTEKAEELILFGQERHWCFLLMPEKGVLKNPVFKNDFYYTEMTDFTTLPGFALERLEAVKSEGFPISQVIIGHEVKVAPEVTETPEKPARPKIDIDTGEIAKVALGAITVAVGAALIAFAYSFVGIFSMLDPQLIVVVKDQENEEEYSWVCLVFWEE